MKAWQFTGVDQPLQRVETPDPVRGPGELISTQKMTMKEITYVGASGAGTREGREVLELMGSGAIKSKAKPITFDDIPAGLDALAKGGVQGRFVAFLD